VREEVGGRVHGRAQRLLDRAAADQGALVLAVAQVVVLVLLARRARPARHARTAVDVRAERLVLVREADVRLADATDGVAGVAHLLALRARARREVVDRAGRRVRRAQRRVGRAERARRAQLRRHRLVALALIAVPAANAIVAVDQRGGRARRRLVAHLVGANRARARRALVAIQIAARRAALAVVGRRRDANRAPAELGDTVVVNGARAAIVLELAQAGGVATAADRARALLGVDEAQIGDRVDRGLERALGAHARAHAAHRGALAQHRRRLLKRVVARRLAHATRRAEAGAVPVVLQTL